MRVERVFGFLLLLACETGAATLTVQSGTCGGAGCFSPVTLDNVNAAIAAAACGDTVQIQAGQAASITTPGQALNFAKACPVGHEITVTTTLAAWLPDPRDRILPSYRNLLPAISLDGPIQNHAAVTIISRSPVPSGLKLVGIWFRQTSAYRITDPGNIYTYWMYVGDPNTTNADSPAIFPDNITLDRVLFYGTYESNKSFTAVIRLNSKAFTMTGSYVGGMNGTTLTNAGGGLDTSAVRCGDGCQPVVLHNNLFCCGWTEHFFTGGNPKGFSNGSPMAANIDFQNNVIINALRFLPGTSTFLGNDRPSLKNCFELKEGTDSVFRGNSCHNSWSNDFSQWFGTKIASYQESYPRNYINGFGVGAASSTAAVSGAGSTVTISPLCGPVAQSSMRPGSVLGLAVVATPNETVYFTNGEWEYHKIVSTAMTGAGCTQSEVLTVDAPYVRVANTAASPWMIISNAWATTQRVTVANNVFRNAATAMELDGGDTADYCVLAHLCVQDLTFSGNLQLIDSPQANFGAVFITPSLVKMTYGGTRTDIQHNQTVILPTAHRTAQQQNSMFQFDSGSNRKWESLRVRSNSGGPSANGGPTGSQLAVSATPDLQWSNNSYLGSDSNSNGANAFGVTNQCAAGQNCRNIWGAPLNVNLDYRLTNPAHNEFQPRADRAMVCGATNATPVVVQTCTPHRFLAGQPVRIADVTGNTSANGIRYVKVVLDASRFSLKDEFGNDVHGNGAYRGGGNAAFALWQGGHDGADVGADPGNMPLLQGLTVTPMSRAVLFQWRVPTVMASVGCQIEVSPGSGLLNDDADYTVVNALRPDYFQRADSDRTNPRALKSSDGRQRWFQVGDSSVATGNDGQAHDLSLTPSATYYYRLLCGGAMERGSFQTAGADSGTSAITVDAHSSVAGATQVRARYGVLSSTLTTGSPVACASGCTLSIPAVSGTSILVYVDELDGSNNVLYTSATPRLLAVR
jgi:hypothetical protein